MKTSTQKLSHVITPASRNANFSDFSMQMLNMYFENCDMSNTNKVQNK